MGFFFFKTSNYLFRQWHFMPDDWIMWFTLLDTSHSTAEVQCSYCSTCINPIKKHPLSALEWWLMCDDTLIFTFCGRCKRVQQYDSYRWLLYWCQYIWQPTIKIQILVNTLFQICGVSLKWMPFCLKEPRKKNTASINSNIEFKTNWREKVIFLYNSDFP